MDVVIPKFSSQSLLLRYLLDKHIITRPRCTFIMRRRLIPEESALAIVQDLAHLATCSSCRGFAYDLIIFTRLYVTEAREEPFRSSSSKN